MGTGAGWGHHLQESLEGRCQQDAEKGSAILPRLSGGHQLELSAFKSLLVAMLHVPNTELCCSLQHSQSWWMGQARGLPNTAGTVCSRTFYKNPQAQVQRQQEKRNLTWCARKEPILCPIYSTRGRGDEYPVATCGVHDTSWGHHRTFCPDGEQPQSSCPAWALQLLGWENS